MRKGGGNRSGTQRKLQFAGGYYNGRGSSYPKNFRACSAGYFPCKRQSPAVTRIVVAPLLLLLLHHRGGSNLQQSLLQPSSRYINIWQQLTWRFLFPLGCFIICSCFYESQRKQSRKRI